MFNFTVLPYIGHDRRYRINCNNICVILVQNYLSFSWNLTAVHLWIEILITELDQTAYILGRGRGYVSSHTLSVQLNAYHRIKHFTATRTGLASQVVELLSLVQLMHLQAPPPDRTISLPLGGEGLIEAPKLYDWLFGYFLMLYQLPKFCNVD